MASHFDLVNNSPINSWPQTTVPMTFSGPWAAPITGNVIFASEGSHVDVRLPTILGTGTTGTYIFSSAVPPQYVPLSNFQFQPYCQNGTGGYNWASGLMQTDGVMLFYPTPNLTVFNTSSGNNIGFYPSNFGYNVNC